MSQRGRRRRLLACMRRMDAWFLVCDLLSLIELRAPRPRRLRGKVRRERRTMLEAEA